MSGHAPQPDRLLDLALHVRGESRYVDDLTPPAGTLHAAVFSSPVAHGRIRRLEVSKALTRPGVRAAFTAGDVPGENQIGGILPDEPLLAQGEVHCVGEPVALIVADTARLARAALGAVELEVEKLPAVFDPREAFRKGLLISPARTFAIGDVDAAWKDCDVVVEGRVDSGGQEHVYLETQAALALPGEGGAVKVISATQGPTGVQKAVARVLGLPMHLVEVEVLRLGGGFGGKEDQATPWACLAALAAFRLGRPVKLVLQRPEDMRLTGKRHPYSSDFRLGATYDGRLLAYQASFYQNSGCTADLSTSILERTLFHATASYHIPNVRATGACCRTNLPSNTAFRGFGGPQAMLVMEAAIVRLAESLGLSPAEVQERNLLGDGDVLPYGQRFHGGQARRCWQTAKIRYHLEERRWQVAEFNRSHLLIKKGLALMPVCFGISFTNQILNQAGALVHVYTDGSVSLATGAVEMGQGVHRKLREVAARAFSIDRERVRLQPTSTAQVPNTSPTAASTGTDLNGRAAEQACRAVLERLKEAAARELGKDRPQEVEIREEQVFYEGRPTSLTWERLVAAAYARRVSLSAQAHYATPGIHFDRTAEKGQPFAYHACGTALCEVTLDCLRGTYTVEAVEAVHDLGPSLDAAADRGQAEGGIVQGLGWLTLEEVLHAGDGSLLTSALASYKVPDIHFAPRRLEVHFLEDTVNPLGVFNAKAIGEPPFMYGIGVYFALRAAMRAFRPDGELAFTAPLTPERVLMQLAGEAR
jgi:xanthine dehydrogenase large subunit